MPAERQDASGRAGFFRRHALGIGVALYAATAATDMYMTLQGIGGDLAMEGNPIMRAMMRRLGPELGLLTEKVGSSRAGTCLEAGPVHSRLPGASEAS